MTILFATVLVLPLTLVFAGLAVDVAALGTLKGRVQRAADAAATAGAASVHFVKDDPECLKDCAGAWHERRDVTLAYAALNGFQAPDVQFTPSVPRVSVVVGAAQPTTFLRLLGINVLGTAARADAVRTNTSQADKDAAEPVPGRSALVR